MLLPSGCTAAAGEADNPMQPIADLLERIDAGASSKFTTEYITADTDTFEIETDGDKIAVRGTDNCAIACGIHWYLKYVAHVHLSWDGMTARLPDRLPPVQGCIRRAATVEHRYAYNYCTFSYSMSFWDWERWEREIDWMALHGINRPLVAVGMEKVWQNLLRRLGYDDSEIDSFIAGPAYQAWWLMDNLEGWGNPSPEGWYDDRSELALKIITRMRQLGIEPILPGYSGKMPSNAREKLGLNVTDTGLWCGYSRPSFLRPDDPHFNDIADLYYDELHKLYGDARYYSCDPFHEGGSTRGVDLDAAGKAVLGAMKRSNPDAVWVLQAWQANPRMAMIENLTAGDLLILDLFAESKPQCGDPSSVWYRPEGFGEHNRIFCMLLNFGGNVGLHGKLEGLVDRFYDALPDKKLVGTGMTPEGIENNPVMFELLTELAWRSERFRSADWLEEYIEARYGRRDAAVSQAWQLLARSVYGCPRNNTQEGTHESAFCSRPTFNYRHTSEFAATQDYYDPSDVVKAAELMLSAAGHFGDSSHFEYDLADIVRQAVAETGRIQLRRVAAAFRSGDADAYRAEYKCFLELIMMQDRLLGTRSEFMVGHYLESARSLGRSDEDKARLELNARLQITTWGDRNASERGGLHDYAHKEWNGILRTLYHDRWKLWFELNESAMHTARPHKPKIDLYEMESRWAHGSESYPSEPSERTVDVAREIFGTVAEIFSRK